MGLVRKCAEVNFLFLYFKNFFCAFGASTLMVWHQEDRLPCKRN